MVANNFPLRYQQSVICITHKLDQDDDNDILILLLWLMNAIIKQQRLLRIFLKLLFNKRSQQQNATYIFFFVQLIILFILFTHSHKSSLLVSKLFICEIIVCNTKEVKKRYLSYRRYWARLTWIQSIIFAQH